VDPVSLSLLHCDAGKICPVLHQIRSGGIVNRDNVRLLRQGGVRGSGRLAWISRQVPAGFQCYVGAERLRSLHVEGAWRISVYPDAHGTVQIGQVIHA